MNTISGYTEIELPDGNKIPLKYGMWTLRTISQRWGVTIDEIQGAMKERLKSDPFGVYFTLIGAAAEYAALAEGKALTLNDAIISSWIDNTGGLTKSPVLEQAMNAFVASMGGELIEPTPVTETQVSAKKSPAPVGA